jgi:hypothetical protein
LARGAFGAASLALLLGCGVEPYIELQIADPVLPFLVAGTDYDALVVGAEAMGCADSETRYDPAPLPASLTVLPGACYRDALRLRASAALGDRIVAHSAWIEAAFPDSGPLVVTATLADLPGRRTLFATGFESGEPFGDRTNGLPIVLSDRVEAFEARVRPEGALVGSQSAFFGGVATSSASLAYARVSALNVVIARGDELVFTLEIGASSVLRTIGVELELSTGATAESLGLIDRLGRPIHPATAQGREPGVRQLWAVDLTKAAGARLVGILLAMDARGTGKGDFSARIDDVSVVRP